MILKDSGKMKKTFLEYKLIYINLFAMGYYSNILSYIQAGCAQEMRVFQLIKTDIFVKIFIHEYDVLYHIKPYSGLK